MDERSVAQKLIGVGGDPFFAASLGYPPLVDLLPSERERLIREHYAQEYREDLRRIIASGAEVTDEEDGEEG
jgi:hypothetical protein